MNLKATLITKTLPRRGERATDKDTAKEIIKFKGSADEATVSELRQMKRAFPTAANSERYGSLIKTAQGQLMHPVRPELPSRSRYSPYRTDDYGSSSSHGNALGGAARILRSCRRETSEEKVVSLDESLERNREYWWIPAENRDQSAVSFALQKMTVVVLSEKGVFAHF